MTKVYLVTDGCYSDYHILGVYSTTKKANEARRFFNADNVETYDLDALPETNVPQGMFLYYVKMGMNGDNAEANRESNGFRIGWDWEPYGKPGVVGFHVCARDEVHAIKIANERRIALKASGQLHDDWDRWRAERETSRDRD